MLVTLPGSCCASTKVGAEPQPYVLSHHQPCVPAAGISLVESEPATPEKSIPSRHACCAHVAHEGVLKSGFAALDVTIPSRRGYLGTHHHIWMHDVTSHQHRRCDQESRDLEAGSMSVRLQVGQLPHRSPDESLTPLPPDLCWPLTGQQGLRGLGVHVVFGGLPTL